MKMKKLLAFALTILMAFTLVPMASFAEGGSTSSAPTQMTEAERAEAIDELLAFSGRLHEMTVQYTNAIQVEYADEVREDSTYALARIIVECEGTPDLAGSVAHVDDHNGLWVIQYASPDDARKALERFSGNEGIVYAAPDLIVQADQDPHTYEFLSWGYYNEWVKTYTYTEQLLEHFGSVENLPEVVVGVIDTGIDFEHEYFGGMAADGGRIKEGGWDFVNNDGDPQDDYGHGSLVSGTICDGTLPNVKIMPLKVLASDGHGSAINRNLAIEYAYLNGCHVVNLSLGSAVPWPVDPKVVRLLADAAASEYKTVYCVSAGNKGEDAGNYTPGNTPGAFTVAAHNQANEMCVSPNWASNYGDVVDITAPGDCIRSVKLGGGMELYNGTSSAAPHAAAACALLKSLDINMEAEDVMNTLKAMAKPANFPPDKPGGAGLLFLGDGIELPKYKISFKDGFTGGEIPGSYMVSKSTVLDSANFPEPPEHEGYHFIDWDYDGSPIYENTEITAQYAINTYTVEWQNWNGETLETDYDVPYGTIPEYNGETPEKPDDRYYSYSFAGWDPEPVPAKADAAYTAQFTPIEKDAAFVGNNLRVYQDIKIGFCVKLTEAARNAANAEMVFTVGSEPARTIRVPFGEGEAVTFNGMECYLFFCPMNAKEMADEVTAQFVADGINSADTKTCSIRVYAQKVFAHPELYPADGSLAMLMKSMLNYGAAAQALFDYKTDDPANSILESDDKTVTEVNFAELGYGAEVTGSLPEGVTCEASLVLEDLVKVHFIISGNTEGLIFKLDGREVTPVTENGVTYVETEGLYTVQLDKKFNFTISSAVGTWSVDYGAFDYGAAVQQANTDTNLIKVMQAMYGYFLKANAYWQEINAPATGV